MQLILLATSFCVSPTRLNGLRAVQIDPNGGSLCKIYGNPTMNQIIHELTSIAQKAVETGNMLHLTIKTNSLDVSVVRQKVNQIVAELKNGLFQLSDETILGRKLRVMAMLILIGGCRLVWPSLVREKHQAYEFLRCREFQGCQFQSAKVVLGRFVFLLLLQILMLVGSIIMGWEVAYQYVYQHEELLDVKQEEKKDSDENVKSGDTSTKEKSKVEGIIQDGDWVKVQTKK
eukprot:NODE_921_length_3051_cov_0.675813.p1 type:complete len:231 gc:universal NODE_921_length_3051_cov_0.675813:1956-1264(-)